MRNENEVKKNKLRKLNINIEERILDVHTERLLLLIKHTHILSLKN